MQRRRRRDMIRRGRERERKDNAFKIKMAEFLISIRAKIKKKKLYINI